MGDRRDKVAAMNFLPRLVVLAAILLVFLLPWLFGSLMVGGLAKLGIDTRLAVPLFLAIIVGGFINLPLDSVKGHRGFEEILTIIQV